MTTPNKVLANEAQQLAKGSDGLQRRAAMCVSVALGTTTSLTAARGALEEICLPDGKRAAIALLDRLAAERIGS